MQEPILLTKMVEEQKKPRGEIREALKAMFTSVNSWRRWHGDLFMVAVAILLVGTFFPILGGTVLALQSVNVRFTNIPLAQLTMLGIVVGGVILGLTTLRLSVQAVEKAAKLHNTRTRWGRDWMVIVMVIIHTAFIASGLTAHGVNFFGVESPDQQVVRLVKEKWAEVIGRKQATTNIHPLVAFRYDELTESDAARRELQRAYAQVMHWGDALEVASATHDIPMSLFAAVMHVESSGRSDVCSDAGACGLMGLMPVVADDHDVFDPHQNVFTGASHLAQLITEHGDVVKALAFYNARHAPIEFAYVKASLVGADSLTALATTSTVQQYVVDVLAHELAFAELGASRTGRPREYGDKFGNGTTATEHIVQRGETCVGLAKRYGITASCLTKSNQIEDCQRDLRSGITVTIPPPEDCV